MHLTFATRPSALARWQTRYVIENLRAHWPDLECEEKLITTSGDRILDKSLPEIGGKGVFTQELEAELLSSKVDTAVHSLKDLPVEQPPGLVLGAIPARGEVRDVLVSREGWRLDTLPVGAVIGTSSLRRGAQLMAFRPDLRIEPLRGNVDTRLRKAAEGHYDAIILAGAGISRLGLELHISQWLSLDEMLPAPGQGALAIQCRGDDHQTRDILAVLDHPATRDAVTAERAFLDGLGGGCSVPVAAYASQEASLHTLRGAVAALDGSQIIRVDGRGSEPQALGLELARQALQSGAAALI
jgi:hydroxymethylbilane synthase